MYKDKKGRQSSSSSSDEPPTVPAVHQPQQKTPPRFEDETAATESESPITPTGSHDERKPAAKTHQPSEGESIVEEQSRPRQVIAVSASRGPAAFFNLARKFLVTDEMCDLSALEGAIVSAVDAAHLLERSKLATIVRVQTSYVTVEPKRRKQQPQSSPVPGVIMEEQRQVSSEFAGLAAPVPIQALVPAQASAQEPTSAPVLSPLTASSGRQGGTAGKSGGGKVSSSSGGRELRRARIVITVKRTASYKQWLEENPLQAIIAGDGGEEDEGDPDVQRAT